MDKKPAPTLKQIAEMTGFSQASISMILNKRPDVSFSAETVRAVTAAAEQLGYAKSPSPSSRKPLSGKRAVAVFCPNITNPYYAVLVQAIEQSALASFPYSPWLIDLTVTAIILVLFKFRNEKYLIC